MANDLGNLGMTIKTLRLERGLTQDDFARKLGLTPQAVSKWETGVSYPDITMLPAIADALGVGIDALFGREAPNTAAAQPEASGEGLQISESDRSRFSEEFEGAKLICVYNDRALYSSLAVSSREGCRVDFEDGSYADMATGTVVNYGHGSIFLVHYEDEPKRRSGGFNFFNMFGNQNRVTNSYSGGAIDSVELELAGSGDVEISSGDEGRWSMSVEAAAGFFDNFVCEEKNGCLRISTRRCTGNVSRGLEIKLCTGFTEGENLSVSISGSGDVSVEPSFESSVLHIAGSGDIDAAGVGNADISISGSGDVDFESADDLKVTVAGSGDVNGDSADGMCAFKIAGSGNISVDDIKGQLEVNISGAGDVDVSGSVDFLKIHTSGAGCFSGDYLTAREADISLRGVGKASIGRIIGKSVEKVDRMCTLHVGSRG